MDRRRARKQTLSPYTHADLLLSTLRRARATAATRIKKKNPRHDAAPAYALSLNLPLPPRYKRSLQISRQRYDDAGAALSASAGGSVAGGGTCEYHAVRSRSSRGRADPAAPAPSRWPSRRRGTSRPPATSACTWSGSCSPSPRVILRLAGVRAPTGATSATAVQQSSKQLRTRLLSLVEAVRMSDSMEDGTFP